MKHKRFRTIAAVIGFFGVISISGAVAETTETSIKPPFSAAISGSSCSTGTGGVLATCTNVDAVDPEVGLMSFDLSLQSRLQGYAPGYGSAYADASLGHAYSLEGWANQIEISFILEVDRFDSSGKGGRIGSGWRYASMTTSAYHRACSNCSVSSWISLDESLDQSNLLIVSLKMVNCGGGLIPPGLIDLQAHSNGYIGLGALVPDSGQLHLAFEARLTSIDLSVTRDDVPVACSREVH